MEILFQDDIFVAVNKPAGLLVHRSNIDRHETQFAMQKVRDRLGRRVYPVHRLDKPTSGVLLFALSADDARLMTEVFSNGGVKKTYLAIVRGYTSESASINYPLKEQTDKMTDTLVSKDKPAQPAVTSYRRLATVELPFAVGRYASSRYSLLSVSPETGRKHQIRRHIKHIFHPIIGDTTHVDWHHSDFFRTHFYCHRFLLSAIGLCFAHPMPGMRLNIEAPLDEGFSGILKALGWSTNAGAAQTHL